jgi:hypothetical protein
MIHLKTHKVIKTDTGRVTIQTNAFGIPEIKVRVGDKTHIIGCEHEKIKNLEVVVSALLESKPITEGE